MTGEIHRTSYPPGTKPVLVWDGQCEFCRYWVLFLNHHTEGRLTYRSYQSAAADFRDIPLEKFRQAVRLIEPDGRVFSGADVAYRALQCYFSKTISWFHEWYKRSRFFRKFSDLAYELISGHRSLMYKITVVLFGTDPFKIKHYWLAYLLVLSFAVWLL